MDGSNKEFEFDSLLSFARNNCNSSDSIPITTSSADFQSSSVINSLAPGDGRPITFVSATTITTPTTSRVNFPSLAGQPIPSMSSSELGNQAIFAVAVKLPLFWSSNPTAWFHQAEAQFDLKKITQDRTKYEYVITALPQDVTCTVLDILENPPATDLYENLKKVLIERHSLSEEVRLEKLLNETVSTDQKPSDMYRHLVALAGKSGVINQQLLNRLWMRKLSPLTQSLLKISKNENPQELTAMADTIWETNKRNNISSISQPSHPILPVPNPQTTQQPANVSSGFDPNNFMSQFYLSMSELTSRFQSLETQVAEIRQSNHNSRSRVRSKSPVPGRRFRSRSRSQSAKRQKDYKYCWYHYKFGLDAKTCTPPCQFRSPESDNSKN